MDKKQYFSLWRSNRKKIRVHIVWLLSPDRMYSLLLIVEKFKDYQNGRDFHEVVEEVVKHYRHNRPIIDFDSAAFTDYERVKERICLKVVNTIKQ